MGTDWRWEWEGRGAGEEDGHQLESPWSGPSSWMCARGRNPRTRQYRNIQMEAQRGLYVEAGDTQVMGCAGKFISPNALLRAGMGQFQHTTDNG